MAGALLVRLGYLQVVEQDFLRRQGFLRTFRQIPLNAFRGMIVDRHGEPLAVSTPVDSVWVDPKQVDWHQNAWQQAFALLALSPESTREKIQQQITRDFYYLKRQISPEVAKKIETLQLSGVYLQREYRRYYPAGEVAAQLVGFTNIDDVGQDGLELAFDKFLRGSPGYKQIIRDRYGSQVEGLARAKEPQDGHNIILSIDKRLQYLAYRELAQAVVDQGAKAGALVLLDAKTGEVMAMANYPSYNPNQRNRQVKENLRNRIMTDTFEPGSVMKSFSMANALLHSHYPPGYTINTSPGWMKVGTNVVKDIHHFGVLDLPGILRKSSNVGIAHLT
jgi:cell division protein FtsI (penicillin-binding protein 3)